MKTARTKTIVSLEEILEGVKRLPSSQLETVRDAVSQAMKKPSVKAGKRSVRPLKKKSLLDTPLCGMWADREDIPDSQTFARQLREMVEARGDRRTHVR
jgi:hypothetical protein